MLPSLSAWGAHRPLITAGDLRDIYWQVQRTALTALMPVYTPVHTMLDTQEFQDAQ